MATSTLLTHPSALPRRRHHHRQPPSFNSNPATTSSPRSTTHLTPLTITCAKTPLRHFVEHLPRAKSPPLRHFVEHLPRAKSPPIRHFVEHLPRATHSPQPPDSLPSPLPSSLLSFLPSNLNPLAICKWALLLSLPLFLVRTLLSPFFWTYFSMSWVFWPWQLTLLISTLALHSLYRLHHSSSSSTITTLLHQLTVVSTSILWLTLVPPAHFNGFLEGWPIAFFFLYHYFLFLEASVRRHFYGDLLPRAHNPKWDITLPTWAKSLFSLLIFVIHWFVAREAPELHLMPGGLLFDIATWSFIISSILLRYNSLMYLAKYFENVAEPTMVVRFGPYRWLRHPEYASSIMFLASYCLAMRAPRSMVFVIAVCMAYYGWKAQLEEERMMEEFGEEYRQYAQKVPYRLIPFLY